MAPPKLPKFPTLAERKSLMAQLLEAEQNGTAPTNNEHYRAYAASLKALNEKMDGYSAIDEEYGLPAHPERGGQAGPAERHAGYRSLRRDLPGGRDQ